MPNDYEQSPDHGKVQRICSMCSKEYFAAAGADPGECVSCMLSRAEVNSRDAAYEREQAKRRALATGIKNTIGAKLIVGAIALVLIGAVVVGKQIQDARDNAAERDRANATTDIYVVETQNWKWRLCRCEDFACAAQVKTDFDAWHAATPVPDNAYVKQAAKSLSDSLLECYERLR